MVNRMASILLYVPFIQDYVVNDQVKNALTESEFFGQYFGNIDINKYISLRPWGQSRWYGNQRKVWTEKNGTR